MRRRSVNIDDVRRLAKLGNTRREIAEQLGFSYDIIRYYVRLHKIPCTPEPHAGGSGVSRFWAENSDRLAALVAAGYSAAKAAAELRTTKNACISRALRMGLELRSLVPTLRERRKTLKMDVAMLARIASIRDYTLKMIEAGEPVEAAAKQRYLVALSALEAGVAIPQAHGAALAAAPLPHANHAPKYEPDRAIRSPEVDTLPAMCFSGMDVRTRATGRIGTPEPSLHRSAAS